MSLRAMLYAVHGSPYKGKRQMIHVALAEAVNDESLIGFASQTALAEAARCTVETVRNTIRDMIADGLLTVVETPRWQRATVYRFVIPDDRQGARDAVRQRRQPVENTPQTPTDLGAESTNQTPTDLGAEAVSPQIHPPQPPNPPDDTRPSHPEEQVSQSVTDKPQTANPPRPTDRPADPRLADPDFARWLAAARPGVRRPDRFDWPPGELDQLHADWTATRTPPPATPCPPAFDAAAHGPPPGATTMPPDIAHRIRQTLRSPA